MPILSPMDVHGCCSLTPEAEWFPPDRQTSKVSRAEWLQGDLQFGGSAMSFEAPSMRPLLVITYPRQW
jgi:hypothetical protein